MKSVNKPIARLLNKAHLIICSIFANTIAKKDIDSKNDYFHILDDTELINQIIKQQKSFARLGDGELSLILNDDFNINFQRNSRELQKSLLRVLNSDLENLIVGINIAFNNPSQYNKKVQRYYRTFNYMYREQYKKIIPLNKIYGNASITRFYIDYNHKNLERARQRLATLRQIWSNRDILIVEGEQTKLGVGNDLFTNASNIRRILIPSIDAFKNYDKILNTIIRHVKDTELILISAGPTATVLTYDLAKNGHQAVDLGHIDIEYEWMLKHAKKRIPIPGKYVNEIHGAKYIATKYKDPEYQTQVISIITTS